MIWDAWLAQSIEQGTQSQGPCWAWNLLKIKKKQTNKANFSHQLLAETVTAYNATESSQPIISCIQPPFIDACYMMHVIYLYKYIVSNS